MSLLIAKVGGSLFELPDLGPALLSWADEQPEDRVYFVAGGGDFAEAVSKYQTTHGFDDVDAHWLAVRSMSASSRMLGCMLKLPVIFESSSAVARAVVDCLTALERDETADDALPKSWNVTSDSIAAHIGLRFGATRLVLLKSCKSSCGTDWKRAAIDGYVDEHFPLVAERCRFTIECVDFRAAIR